MSESPGRSSDLRMDVPPPGRPFVLCCAYAFILFFVSAAIYNLIYIRTTPIVPLVASLIWLAIVFGIVNSLASEAGGLCPFLVSQAGYFSRRQFVEADSCDDGRAVICYGYELYGRRFYYLRIATDAIVAVRWGAGQASAISGRDLDDWHVALWYRHPDGPRYPQRMGMRDWELRIIGPSDSRSRIEPLGQSLVGLLESVGVVLRATEDPCEFTVDGRPLFPHTRPETG